MFGILTALTIALPMNAHAVEVAWDGHYRSRIRYFDSLSLAKPADNSNSEEESWTADHRLRLQPGFKLSDQVSLFTDLDVLPFNDWGGNPVLLTDPATGESVPAVYTHSVSAPTAEDGSAGTQNIEVRRAFGQLNTDFARIRFGRMPVEWGSGMVYNAGNDPLSEYGDTADRVQVTAPVGPVYLIGAFETSAENFVNVNDDLKTMTGGVAYLGERVGLGTYNTYRWQRFDDNSQYRLFTGDLWAKAELGNAIVEWEFAFQLGGGDLSDSVNDVRISGLGTQLTALLGGEKTRFGFPSGLATGDSDPYDNEFRTFHFDPDFNVALMMFEEPMPVLMHENSHLVNNGGRETGAVRLGDGVSNALYIKPMIQHNFTEELEMELAWIAARAAKLPDSEMDDKGYGSEVDITIEYKPFEHFELQSTTGAFFPGKYFSSFEHEELGGGFSSAAFGTRLVGTVKF